MLTTIVNSSTNIPTLLLECARNAERWVTRKSPPETADFCRSVPHFPLLYLDIPTQREYLKQFPELWTNWRRDCGGVAAGLGGGTPMDRLAKGMAVQAD